MLKTSGKPRRLIMEDKTSPYHFIINGEWRALCGSMPGSEMGIWEHKAGMKTTCSKCIRLIKENYNNKPLKGNKKRG